MHWSYIFALCLLINGCKNIYSGNNDVCLEGYVMVFMKIASMWWFLCRLLLLKLIVSIKRGYIAVFIQIVGFKTYC